MAKLDDLIQQKQQRDEDWKAKKTAEREELGQLSDDAVMRVTSEPDAYLHYLDTQAINPRYSASNVMLAMAQNPEITYINSLEVWNRLGRSVNRDENGMKIRVSDTYVKDGREYHGYKIGRVFDISQTHGKAGVPALSLKDNTPEMDAALRRLLDSSPVPVVTSSTMYQDAVYDPKTQSITVSSRLIDSKIFAALSREIVHAGIHDHGRYPYYTREDCAMDAESVSYTSYTLNAGELLTPNLVSGSVAGTISGTGGVTVLPPTTSGSSSGNAGSYTPVKYTAVTKDLYYSGGYLGTLKIPTRGLSVKVYQGTDADALRKGAGHFANTSIWEGNVAIAGHNRGVNNHFGKIHTLDIGDTIKLTTQLGTRSYEVYSVSKIGVDDTSVLNDSTENIITLVTCVMNKPDYRWCVQAREK